MRAIELFWAALPVVFGVLVVATLVVSLFFAIAAPGEKRRARLYQSCIDDGRRDYECYGYVYGRRR